MVSLPCLRFRFDSKLNIQGVGNAQDGRQKRRILQRLDTSDSGMCDTCFLSQFPLRPTLFDTALGQICDDGFVGAVDGQKFSPRCYRVKGHGDKKKRPVQPMPVERARRGVISQAGLLHQFDGVVVFGGRSNILGASEAEDDVEDDREEQQAEGETDTVAERFGELVQGDNVNHD